MYILIYSPIYIYIYICQVKRCRPETGFGISGIWHYLPCKCEVQYVDANSNFRCCQKKKLKKNLIIATGDMVH